MSLDYLNSVKKQFVYYKQLGDKTIEQLTEEQLFWQYNPESNSIATIVKHLWGNMLSRWSNFLTTDGEKEWRNRDAEFENDLTSKDEVLQKWNEGWISATWGKRLSRLSIGNWHIIRIISGKWFLLAR